MLNRQMLKYLTILSFILPISAKAKVESVDLLLVLATDVSDSINDRSGVDEFALQKNGIVAALRDPQVLELIKQCPKGIGITYVEWSGRSEMQETKQVVEWTKILDAESIDRFTKKIENSPRSFQQGTDVERALVFSMELLKNAPFKAETHIIDISSDGHQNVYHSRRNTVYRGETLVKTRDEIVRNGVTINALVITNDDGDGKDNPQLPAFFRDKVIGGKDAFMVPIKDFKDYGEALKQKLLRELYCPLIS